MQDHPRASPRLLHPGRDPAQAGRAARLSPVSIAVVDQRLLGSTPGSLSLTGRDRDMVITGGVNVYPVELENALLHHPDIRELAVIGLPDAQWGECLTTVYVGPRELDTNDARAWVARRLSSSEIPRRCEPVDALPRNSTGKVLERELVQRFA